MQLEFLINENSATVTTEEWIPVAGFPRYEVSNMGRFRNKSTGQHLSGSRSNNGYIHIGLTKDGHQITKLAHRLVAQSWLEKPSPAHSDVNHANKIRSDNRISNLEWATRSWNATHSKQKVHILRQAVNHIPGSVRPPFMPEITAAAGTG